MSLRSRHRTGAWKAIGLALELGYLIAIPLVLGATGGRMIDRRLETSPLFLLIGVFLAFVLSSIAVGKKALDIMHESKEDTTHTEQSVSRKQRL